MRLLLALLLFGAEPAVAQTKGFLTPVAIISAGSMAGNLTSSTVKLNYLDNVGIQCVWTGIPTGSFYVDVSDDPTNLTWTALTLAPAPTAAGVAGNFYADLNQISAPYIRVRYVFASDTGTLNCKLGAKAI